MRLSEAYGRLELAHPVQHERRVLEECEGVLSTRRLGTTVRTLVELYLDLERATKSIGWTNANRVKFLYVCLHPAQGRQLRQELQRIHGVLDLDVDPLRVQFFPHDGPDRLIEGYGFYSWSIFCDHSVKELGGHERTFGPFGLVRSIQRRGDVYTAYDRDGHRVCLLTKQGTDDVISHSTCPITFSPDRDVSSITFGAWSRNDLVSAIRMKEAFEL
jgi:hypothetical protein